MTDWLTSELKYFDAVVNANYFIQMVNGVVSDDFLLLGSPRSDKSLKPFEDFQRNWDKLDISIAINKSYLGKFPFLCVLFASDISLVINCSINSTPYSTKKSLKIIFGWYYSYVCFHYLEVLLDVYCVCYYFKIF